jgi:hypothetical protein
MRYAALAVLLTNLIALPALADDKARPHPGPELSACYETCKKQKDTRRNEDCMNKCTADYPMLPPQKAAKPAPQKK